MTLLTLAHQLRKLLIRVAAADGPTQKSAERRGEFFGSLKDELTAERAVAATQTVPSFERKRPSRKPFPEHLRRDASSSLPQKLPLLWVDEVVKAGRGYHRDVGGESRDSGR